MLDFLNRNGYTNFHWSRSAENSKNSIEESLLHSTYRVNHVLETLTIDLITQKYRKQETA